MMIFFVIQNGKSPVQLFGHNEPDQLMGKGKPGKGNDPAGLEQYAFVQSIGATDEKYERAGGKHPVLVQQPRQLQGCQLIASFVEHEIDLLGFHNPQQNFRFLFFQGSRTQFTRIFACTEYPQLKIAVMLQSAAKHLHPFCNIAGIFLPEGPQLNFHFLSFCICNIKGVC